MSIGWGLTGSVGSKLGHIWVETGSNMGHVGHLGHVNGSMGHEGDMCHMGHRASEFMQNFGNGATGLPCKGLMSYWPVNSVQSSVDFVKPHTIVPQRIESSGL